MNINYLHLTNKKCNFEKLYLLVKMRKTAENHRNIFGLHTLLCNSLVISILPHSPTHPHHPTGLCLQVVDLEAVSHRFRSILYSFLIAKAGSPRLIKCVCHANN